MFNPSDLLRCVLEEPSYINFSYWVTGNVHGHTQAENCMGKPTGSEVVIDIGFV